MKKRMFLTSMMALSMLVSLSACQSKGETGPKGDTGASGTNGKDGTNGRGIVSIEKTNSDGSVDTYTITYSDGTTSTYTVKNGENGKDGKDGTSGKDGDNGKDGVSVTKIEKTSTEGNTDTYTITYSDGTTSYFVITNGEDGEKGIQGIPGEDGHTPVITINEEGYWCVDGVSTGVLAKGEKGDKGEPGEKGDKGDKGSDGKDGKDGTSLLTGNGKPNDTLGSDGDSYIDLDTWDYYTKSNGTWTSAGNIKGTKGDKGSDGKDGSDGNKGDKGDSGLSVSSCKVDENGNLIITLSDGNEINAGKVTGSLDTTQYTVNFHIGDRIVKTELVDEFSHISAPSEEYTKGYTVTSWFIKDGSGNVTWDFNGYMYRVYSNLDLYAQYTANTYTISFVDNDKKIDYGSLEVTYGEEYTLPKSTVEGYTVHWMTHDGVEINSGTYTTDSDMTLYAYYEGSKANITLDAKGGALQGSNTLSIEYGKTYTIETPTKAGYEFLGWYDSNGNKIEQTGTSTWEEDFILTAKWKGAVTYGTYPQSKVIDETLTAALTKEAGTLPTSEDSSSWTSYDYYANGSNETPYMWYQDVTYEKETYRGVYFTSIRPTRTDNELPTFKETNGYSINKVHWFKWESIYWDVITSEKGENYLVTDKILDSQQYYAGNHNSATSRSTYDDKETEKVYDNNYKFSDLRGWLNTTFYTLAFTSDEKNSILESVIDNSASSTGNASNRYACADTNDKVTVLSYKEANDASSSGFSNLDAETTDYAQCQGVQIKVEKSKWWTRSPGSDMTRVFISDYGGVVASSLTSTYYTDIGVRPAIHTLTDL